MLRLRISVLCMLVLCVQAHGDDPRPFPTYSHLFSKFDAKTYAMGDCYLFSTSALSIHNNPAGLSSVPTFLVEGGYTERPGYGEREWGDTVTNPCQFVGLTYPHKRFSFGIAYALLCRLREQVSVYGDDSYVLFKESILRSFLLGTRYSFGNRLDIGASIGLTCGVARFPYESLSRGSERTQGLFSEGSVWDIRKLLSDNFRTNPGNQITITDFLERSVPS